MTSSEFLITLVHGVPSVSWLYGTASAQRCGRRLGGLDSDQAPRPASRLQAVGASDANLRAKPDDHLDGHCGWFVYVIPSNGRDFGRGDAFGSRSGQDGVARLDCSTADRVGSWRPRALIVASRQPALQSFVRLSSVGFRISPKPRTAGWYAERYLLWSFRLKYLETPSRTPCATGLDLRLCLR